MTNHDPIPLTRKELSEFLPSQRAIKAFEKLFELIPADLVANENSTEQLMSLISSVRLRISSLEQEQEIQRLKASPSPKTNLDPLIKRIEFLESLIGGD